MSAAHPRSRGENDLPLIRETHETGSSPLTRGKPDERRGHGLWVGLIPAHAGKTMARRSHPSSKPAHPRSRGENEIFLPAVISASGSSPLTRGKLP